MISEEEHTAFYQFLNGGLQMLKTHLALLKLTPEMAHELGDLYTAQYNRVKEDLDVRHLHQATQAHTSAPLGILVNLQSVCEMCGDKYASPNLFESTALKLNRLLRDLQPLLARPHQGFSAENKPAVVVYIKRLQHVHPMIFWSIFWNWAVYLPQSSAEDALWEKPQTPVRSALVSVKQIEDPQWALWEQTACKLVDIMQLTTHPNNVTALAAFKRIVLNVQMHAVRRPVGINLVQALIPAAVKGMYLDSSLRIPQTVEEWANLPS